jgi:hypothetical protein
VIGAFVAATVVGLVQYVRLRDRRLIPVMATLLFMAFTLSQGWWQGASDLVLGTVCLVGLLLLLVFCHRPPATIKG